METRECHREDNRGAVLAWRRLPVTTYGGWTWLGFLDDADLELPCSKDGMADDSPAMHSVNCRFLKRLRWINDFA